MQRAGGCVNWMKQKLSNMELTHEQTQNLRRGYHIFLQFSFIGIAYLVATIIILDVGLDKDFTFDKSELTLEVSACRISLKSDSDGEDGVTVHVNSRIKKEFWNNTEPVDTYFDKTSTSLKLLNPVDYLDACDIEIKAATFPDLTIICDDF